MKKLLYLFIAIVIPFTSCKKDDDAMDTDSNEANIVGTWKLASETENGTPVDLGPCDFIVTFNQNGSGSDESTFGDNCEMTENDNFTYTINEDQLSITYPGDGTFTVEIESLSNTTLVIKDVDIEEGEEDFTYIQTFTKQ